MKKGCAWIAGIVVALMVLGAIVGKRPTDRRTTATAHPHPTAEATSTPPEPPFAITAQQLGRAFDANELAAKNMLADHRVAVTGRITRIGETLGSPIIDLQSTHFVQASFDSDEAPALAQLRAGQTITLTCTGVSEALSILSLQDCALPN